jgi:hypothetical protein
VTGQYDDEQAAKAQTTTVTRTVRAPRLLPLRVERFAYFGGPSQPTELAPRDTRITLRRMAANPRLLFVHWKRDDDPRNRKEARIGAAGVVLWRQERSPEGAMRWRALYQRRYSVWAWVDVETGDITGDGVPEVLHSYEEGSGGCGPHYVVSVAGKTAREIFRRDSCETDYRILRRVFMINEPVGPCPMSPASVHCFGGKRLVRMRWTGTRLVPATVKVECLWPKLELDPSNECRRRAR